jgi:histidinol phosphatase-like PHP family hydrolase
MPPDFRFHDLHVHTWPHSLDAHGLAWLPFMLYLAKRRGVSVIGLANHYFLNTPFRIFQRLPRQVRWFTPTGLTVLVGAELCVLNRHGDIKLTADEANQLDFVLAGPHHFKQRWVEKPPHGDAAAFVAHQHEMLLNAARQPLVNGLAHPWVINLPQAPQRWGFTLAEFLMVWTETHWAELGAVAAQHNTALEIGYGLHFMAHHQGEIFWQRYLRGLQAARSAGAKFYLGSDAHHLHVIARLDWLRPTLQKLGFQAADVIEPEQWRQK